MKRKLFISSLLTTLLGFSLFGGLSAKKEASVTKADDTWVYMITLDLSDSDIPSKPGFNASTLQFACYDNTDPDSLIEAFLLHESGVENVYTVIAEFESSFQFDTVRFVYGSTVYSNTKLIEMVTSDSSYRCLKASHVDSYTQGLWDIKVETMEGPTLDNGETSLMFIYNDDESNFYLEDVELLESDTVSFFMSDGDEYTPMFDDTSSEVFFSEVGTNYAYVKKDATVTIIIDNNYSDNGVVHFRGGSIESGSIYLVDVSEDTNIYISGSYGDGAFGAYPGERLGDIDEASVILTTIKLDGSEVSIYKINLDIGAPYSEKIIFSEVGDEYDEEKAIELTNLAAYYAENDAYVRNYSLGSALNFVYMAEGIRNDGSICLIGFEDAYGLVEAYNELSNDARECVSEITIYTFKKDGTSGYEDVSYKDVIEELGRKYELSVKGSNAFFIHSLLLSSNTTLIILITSTITLLFILLLIIFKKKGQH